MRRRALLASLGATATLSAGCLTTVTERLDESVQLGWFGAHNLDDEVHQFELRVERGDTQVHNSTHVIQPKEDNHFHGAVADCTWGSTSGDYTVLARVDDNEWVAASLTELAASWNSDVGCVIADAMYHREGEVEIVLGNGCDRHYDGMCSFTDR
jgi:hypothetical protein